MEAVQENKYYTYSDYLKWEGNTRYELIGGVAYMMSPAPTQIHQEISGEIFRQMANFLLGKPCKVFHAPFDVRLNGAGNNDDTVVQPDMLVVCDESKLDGKGLNGAPDLAVEILSPSTASRDRVIKFNKYLQAGVREYWIIDPDSKTVSVYVLEDGKYIASAYGDTGVIPVNILEGCEISLEDVFSYQA